MPQETITLIIMSAPAEQLSRAQIIYQDYQAGNIANATCAAIAAARETREAYPEWSSLCGDFAAICLHSMEDKGIIERMPFIAAILDMTGNYLNATLTQINHAVYLSCIALVSDNLQTALQHGLDYLRHQQLNPIGQHS
jgi:hypothetical protein